MNASESLYLPQEIVEEILSRLAVKPLLRFRCVSKSWRSLIGSERFIRTQLESSIHRRAIFRYNGIKQCSLHTLLNEPSVGPSPASDDPTINEGFVVGCCNGLLCIRNKEKWRLLLWNPSTRISFELPKIESLLPNYACGFGYDAAGGAYKVFVVVFNRIWQQVGQVYSSKTNSWRKVDGSQIPIFPFSGSGKFVCGKIYWLSSRGIYSFDLKSEAVGVIKNPCNGESVIDRRLGEIEGCLSLVCESSDKRQFDVWIMKESWMKVMNVTYDCCPFSAQFQIASEGVFLPLNRDDTVLLVPNKFPYKLSTLYREIHFYVESLVSPVRVVKVY